MGIKKWDEFLNERESSNVVSETTEDNAATGENLDAGYRDEGEYKKMLDFLRGKKNVANGALGDKPTVPKSAAKGWFIVDEQSRGFWHDGKWTQDIDVAKEAIINSEKGATDLAKLVGGVVIPAEEILS